MGTIKRTAAVIVALAAVFSLCSCDLIDRLIPGRGGEQTTAAQTVTEKETEYELDGDIYGVWYTKTGEKEQVIEIMKDGRIALMSGTMEETVDYKLVDDDRISFKVDGKRYRLRYKDGELIRYSGGIRDGYTYTKEAPAALVAETVAGDWHMDIADAGDLVGSVGDFAESTLGDDEVTRALLGKMDLSVIETGMMELFEAFVFRFTEDSVLYFKVDPDMYRDAYKKIMASVFDEMGWLTSGEVAEAMGYTEEEFEERLAESGSTWSEFCESAKVEELAEWDAMTNEDIADSVDGILDPDGLVRLSESGFSIDGNVICADEDSDGEVEFLYENGVLTITAIESGGEGFAEAFVGMKLYKEAN
jgi:hypothetical protein